MWWVGNHDKYCVDVTRQPPSRHAGGLPVDTASGTLVHQAPEAESIAAGEGTAGGDDLSGESYVATSPALAARMMAHAVRGR